MESVLGDLNKMNGVKLNENTIYVYVQTYQLGEKYLIRALDSIQKQTYSNFKCLIYDNCSDMKIRRRLQEYVKDDERFSVTYFDKTEGHIIAWEYGIPEILYLGGECGGYFCRVDADDELELDCFEKMIAFMTKNNLDMVASGSTFIEAETMEVRGVRGLQGNVILEGDLFEKRFPDYYQIMRTHWGKLYKLDVIKRMNLSNFTIVPYGADTLFVREAMLKADRVGILEEPLYRYYIYPEQRVYDTKKGRVSAPKILLERDFSFILQKCGRISGNTIAWLINVYLQENVDVFNLLINNRNDSWQKIDEIYSVLSSIPCRMAMRLGARGKYKDLCDWLLYQNILENEQAFDKCCEIFGILCVVPEQIPNGGYAELFKFLVKLYDFWDDYDSKGMVEKKILSCARNSLLLQDCDFYYCKFNADIVELLLREKYEDAYKQIKEAISKQFYFEKQFIKKNVELGQNIAAILQNETEYVYMSKQMIGALMEDDLSKALEEVNEWVKILPEDEDFIDLNRSITRKMNS